MKTVNLKNELIFRMVVNFEFCKELIRTINTVCAEVTFYTGPDGKQDHNSKESIRARH